MTQLPAYLQNRQSKALAETIASNVGSGSPAYVSIMGNRFTLIDAVGDEIAVTTAVNGIPYLDCVVIDALEHESKIYYIKPFDPNQQSWSPPDCWSDNGVAPSRNAGAPQSPSCGTCPKAVWGSATSRVSGKGIPACAKYQKLALLIPGEEFPFLLRVPPNSLSNLRDYIQKFKGQQFDISDVVTRVSFEPGGIGTLVFNAVSVIDEGTARKREGLVTAKATDNLVGRGDLPRQGVLSPPMEQQQMGIAQPAAPMTATPATPQSLLPSGTPLPAATNMQQPAGGVTTASPSEQPQQGRRRRRQTTEAPAQAQPQSAPFAQAGPAPNFGVAAPAAPTAEINTMLDSLFKS